MFDLHIHSTFSDGSDNLDELIDKISEAGIHYFSITDHDTALSARTIFGDEQLQKKIKDKKLTYVSGVEWSCIFNGHSVHILSYDINPFSDVVLKLENEIKNLLKLKNDFRFQAIKEMGYNFSNKSIDFLNTRQNIRKLDIANCLVNDGYFASIQDAIDLCLKKIKYPQKYKLDGKEVISKLCGIGAKMVWAHSIHGLNEKPITFDEIEKIVAEMKEYGLSGLECYYSLYNAQEIEKLIEIANKYGLFITCGSDYHGKNKTVTLAETSCDNTQVNYQNLKFDKIFKNVIK